MQIWRTKEWLEEHYCNKKLSWIEIGKIVNRSATAVRLAAREFGISSRSISDIRLSIHNNITKEILEDLYLAKNMSTKEIANELSVSPSIIYNRLKHFNIQTRTNVEGNLVRTNNKGEIPRSTWATKDWLINAYSTMSIAEIAAVTGWSHTKIIDAMDELAVPRRSSSDAMLLKSPIISQRMKNAWKDGDYRGKMAKIFATRPKVSHIQEVLYNILDDLGIVYYREHNDKLDDNECLIGDRAYDCVIPRNGKPTLLIECQGNYYHSRRGASKRDLIKYSDTNTKFPGQYEVKQLWEHEFYCESRVSDKIKYWLGLYSNFDFDMCNVMIQKINRAQAKQFFEKYHYLGGIGCRGSLMYGAFLNQKLIAAIVFSSLVRQNITIDNYQCGEIREISRLCIHPQYHKKNFASWFTAKCLKKLPKQYKLIIAYSDTTYNHCGTIYKACGFSQDKIITSDYWYCDEDGRRIHKKTLYNHAVSSQMTESEFAEKFGFIKVFGSHKYRYVKQLVS